MTKLYNGRGLCTECVVQGPAEKPYDFYIQGPAEKPDDF